jgi:hypothetical protein
VRKLWYAGAVVAGGIFLFGAAPAQADVLPGTGTAEQQADDQLTDLLGQSNGINVENPLRYSTMGTTPLGAPPVLQFKSGQNTPDLNPVLPASPPGRRTSNCPIPAYPAPAYPALAYPAPACRTPSCRPPMWSARRAASATACPSRTSSVQQLPLRNLPLVGLLGGLLPSGGTPNMLQRPTARQAETFDGGMPLLGGLGGLLPVNALPRPGDGPDVTGVPDASGLPAGGMAIVPAATTPPTFGKPATDQPAQSPKPAATLDDAPRLHEEPVDGEATAPRRDFTPDGRPVAGIDEQYP